jgi:predicted DCC family thiol-disulfide oxidoreductase YuxK
MDEHQAALLFDADCGFCRWSTDRIIRWDRAGSLRPVAIQGSEADALLASVPEGSRTASWHLVADGRVRSAGRAVAPLLRLLPGGRPLAAVAEAFPRATDAVYSWISRHRGLLGKIVGQKACAVMPSRWESDRRGGPLHGKGPGE